MVPIGCWARAGLGPEAHKLEGGFHNGAHQHQCPRGRRSSPNGCHYCLCPPGELQLSLASLGNSPKSADRSDQRFFQITDSALGSRACEILCVPFRSGVSVSSSPLGLPKVSLTDLQIQMFWGLVFPGQYSQAGEPDMGFRPLTPWGEPLQL